MVGMTLTAQFFKVVWPLESHPFTFSEHNLCLHINGLRLLWDENASANP
jgi:hypothetical protein